MPEFRALESRVDEILDSAIARGDKTEILAIRLADLTMFLDALQFFSTASKPIKDLLQDQAMHTVAALAKAATPDLPSAELLLKRMLAIRSLIKADGRDLLSEARKNGLLP